MNRGSRAIKGIQFKNPAQTVQVWDLTHALYSVSIHLSLLVYMLAKSRLEDSQDFKHFSSLEFLLSEILPNSEIPAHFNTVLNKLKIEQILMFEVWLDEASGKLHP